MNTSKHVKRLLGLAAMTAIVVGTAATAHASPAPPKADPTLSGTWVNVNPASNSVKQIVINPNRVNSVNVDAFGACSPTLCEWGSVPAISYGTSAAATTGTAFQSNQRFLTGRGAEWSRTSLQGHVVRTLLGLRLVVREMTVFEDGTNRKNYSTTEVFQLGKGLRVTKLGSAVGTYPLGQPPALNWGAFGSWTTSPTGGLISVRITGTPAHPVISAAGQCSPTPCAWGTSTGITYGTSISSSVGNTVVAPYVFGFKKSQLVIQYTTLRTGQPALHVVTYSEFTDGSSRSNYVLDQTFVRV